MYAVDPLGLSKAATNPWLPGSTAGPLVALAWILLFGGPAAAAVLAGRRCRGPDGSKPPGHARIGQGVAAGVLANGTAAMAVTTRHGHDDADAQVPVAAALAQPRSAP